MKKILIIRFSSIGDIIQCLGSVGPIREKYPDAQIHWVTRKDMAPILSLDKRVDKIWGFDKNEGLKGLLKLSKELRKEKYDLVYDAHLNIRSKILKLKLFTFPFCKPRIITRSKYRFKRVLLFKFGINTFPWPFIGVDSFRNPLKKYGISSNSDNAVTWEFEDSYKAKFASLIQKNTITLVPSANWQMKRWPVEYWKRLIELLKEYNFVILAGPSDHFCEEIAKVAPSRVINLAGETSLIESCYITSISNLVISADTGFMHSADLFHTPTLALMGPTAFGYPFSSTSRIIDIPLKCRPCTKDGRGECKDAIFQRCMVEITPEKIARLSKEIVTL